MTGVTTPCASYGSALWYDWALRCLSRCQVKPALPFQWVVDHKGCHCYLCALVLLCESAQVITASVKSFAHCFSSPHGHHSRKSITQGNTKSQRPIYYSIAKSRKNLDKSGIFFSLAQVRVNMVTEKNTKECLM